MTPKRNPPAQKSPSLVMKSSQGYTAPSKKVPGDAHDMKQEIDLRTPEATVKTFARLLADGDMDRIAACFVDGADDLRDLRQIMQSNKDEPGMHAFRKTLESIGPPIEITDIKETQNGLAVTWLSTVKKPFTIGKGGKQRTWQAGDQFELDATLVMVDNK